MMRHAFLMFAIVCAGLVVDHRSAHAQDKATTGDAKVQTGTILKRNYFYKEAGKDMEYALFVPNGYDGKKPFPLIVALHGLMATPQIMIRYPGFTDLAQKHGYIIVAPMGYNVVGWYGSKGMKSPKSNPENLGELSEKDVMNVLELTRKELNIDPNRTYLMGHSMGGGGTWHIGLKYPEHWAALAPIAPAIYRSPDELTKIKHLPVILVQGEKDSLVPVKMARNWAAKMKELGMTHEYIEVKGGDHIFPAFQKLPEVFAFFNKHTKKPAGAAAQVRRRCSAENPRALD